MFDSLAKIYGDILDAHAQDNKGDGKGKIQLATFKKAILEPSQAAIGKSLMNFYKDLIDPPKTDAKPKEKSKAKEEATKGKKSKKKC